MESGEISIKAYVARKVAIGSRSLATKFQEVDVEVQTAEMESIGGMPLRVVHNKPVARLQWPLAVHRRTSI
jgi:hypothetical protein